MTQSTQPSQNTRKLGKFLTGQAGKAIGDYQMIEEGDTVLVCISGGKDSYTLLHLLMTLQKRAPISFKLIAMNLDQQQPGFPKEILPEYFESIGVQYHIVESDTYSIVQDKIPEGKTTCSLCSRLRRGIIYRTAKSLGANKIALGHHRDDIVQTLFLNLIFGGKLKAMPPKLLTDDAAHVVIRPLAYCAEEDIAKFARGMEFPIIPCNLCGSQSNLQRQKIREMMQDWDRRYPGSSRSVLTALQDVVPSHLADQNLFDFQHLKIDENALTTQQPAAVQTTKINHKFGGRSAKPEHNRSSNMLILFADIVSSTSLYLELGDKKAFEAIQSCKSCILGAAEKFGGFLIKSLGDGELIGFKHTDDAIQAAISMQEQVRVLKPVSSPSYSQQMNLRLGMHYGHVLNESGDVYGDTVNLAARLMEEARSGQILASLQAMLQCSDQYRKMAIDLGNILVKGRPEEVNLFSIPWNEQASQRKPIERRPLPSEAKATPKSSDQASTQQYLKLQWGQQTAQVDSSNPVLILGSDDSCGIPIHSNASIEIAPFHARIEYRNQMYYLIDYSNSGTHLLRDGESNYLHLRHEETLLRQNGYLYLGSQPPEQLAQGIRYQIATRNSE